MLGKLKVELKRALRSRMNATINAVCVDFEEHVDFNSSRPATTVEDAEFDRYFDYCRRLVKYIAKTMDTSPNFVEKMDSIILASRNDAPKKMLDAVVKQDVWFHRHSDVHSEKKMETEDTTTSPLQVLGKRKPTQTKPPSKRCRVDPISTSQVTDDANLSEEGTSVFELHQKENHESGDDQEGENDESESNVMENQESEKDTITAVDADKVGDLCLLKPQYPGQLEAIKVWIHDVNKLIDAQCCTPPTGYTCSQSCAKIMKKRNNESNLHRTWQSVEVHLEECHSQQCELKTRVELRQTMHLIEVKQLEIYGVRRDLKEKKVNWSMAVHYSDKACWTGDLSSHDSEIKLREEELLSKNEELAALESKKTSLCARMDIIRLDWRDEITESPGESVLHYVRNV